PAGHLLRAVARLVDPVAQLAGAGLRLPGTALQLPGAAGGRGQALLELLRPGGRLVEAALELAELLLAALEQLRRLLELLGQDAELAADRGERPGADDRRDPVVLDEPLLERLDVGEQPLVGDRPVV